MATVMNINHFSIYLKRNMECTVILPSDIKNDEKLPVLWLYHVGRYSGLRCRYILRYYRR